MRIDEHRVGRVEVAGDQPVGVVGRCDDLIEYPGDAQRGRLQVLGGTVDGFLADGRARHAEHVAEREQEDDGGEEDDPLAEPRRQRIPESGEDRFHRLVGDQLFVSDFVVQHDVLDHQVAGEFDHVRAQAVLAFRRVAVDQQAQDFLQHQLLEDAVGGDVVLVDIFHHDLQRLVLVLGGPFPAFPAGFGKGTGLVLVFFVIRPGHVDAVFLNVVAVVAEAVHALVRNRDAGLHELVVFIVTHRDRCINGALDEEIDVGREADPVIVEVLLDAHAHRDLAEPGAPDSHARSFLGQRVDTAARDDDHRVVHRGLEDVDERDACIHNFHRLAELKSRRLAFVVLDAAHRRLGGGRVDDVHVEACVAVEAQFLGHVVAGELRLRRPLRREDEALLGPGSQGKKGGDGCEKSLAHG